MTAHPPDRKYRSSYRTHHDLSPNASRRRLLRMWVGVVFLVAGLIRLRDAAELARTLETIHLVPQGTIPWIAWCLPAVEFIAGGLLLAGIRSRAAACGLLLTTVAMFTAVGLAFARGFKIEWGVYSYLGGRFTGVLMLVTYAALGLVTVVVLLGPTQRTARNRLRLPRLFIPQNHR